MSDSPQRTLETPAAADADKAAEKAKADRESREPTVSEPGGFRNDPDDPTNPNEAIERHRRKLRPTQGES